MGYIFKHKKCLCVCVQAVLKNTMADYDKAGSLPKPKTKQLELRLVQSVNQIQSPVVEFFTQKL